MPLEPEMLDDQTLAICLDVPGVNVVALQGYFETYEGLGLVRTLDLRRSLVCVLTTPSMLADCLKLLHEIRPVVGWQPAARPPDMDAERFLGYFKEKEPYAEILS